MTSIEGELLQLVVNHDTGFELLMDQLLDYLNFSDQLLVTLPAFQEKRHAPFVHNLLNDGHLDCVLLDQSEYSAEVALFDDPSTLFEPDLSH